MNKELEETAKRFALEKKKTLLSPLSAYDLFDAFLAGAAHMQAQSAGVWVSGYVLPEKTLNRHPVIAEGCYDLGWYEPDVKRWRDEDGCTMLVSKWLSEFPTTGGESEAVDLHK